MKTKMKRHSRSVLSVILAICILISCMVAGLIATDAAKTADQRVGAKADDEAVGETTYRYLWYDMSSNSSQLSALSTKVTLSSTDDNYYTGSFSSNGSNIHFIINNSSSAHTSSSLNSSTTVTPKGSVASWTRRYENSGSYGVEGQLAKGSTYYIGYNVSTNTVIVGSSSSDISSGGSGGGESGGESGGETTYYFRGSSNGWKSDALTSLGDNYFYYATQVSSGVTFKITDNTNWSGSEWNKDNLENSLGDVSDLGADGTNIKANATCYIMFNSTKGKVWAVKNNPSTSSYYKQFAQIKFGSGTSHEIKYGRVYFDNTTSNWSVNKVYLVVGHASYVKAYLMTALSNTKLYGLALNDGSGFDDAKYIAFVGTNSTGISSTYTGSSQNKTFTGLLKDNRSNITYSSQLFTDSSLALNNSNNTYPFTSGSAGDACSLTGTWSSDTPNVYFNKTQTINVYTNKASSSSGGSVSKSGYAVSGTSPYNSSTTTTGTAPALTSTYTLTATANQGYEFDGFYSDSSCSTKITSGVSGNKLTYTVTGTRTIYVNFKNDNTEYTLTKNSTTNGSFKLTNSSGTEITKAKFGDTVKVVPTANTGYQTGTVARGTTSSLGTTVSNNQFTMPASNQYVGVTFTEVTGSANAQAVSTSGGTVKVGTGTASSSVTVSGIGIDSSKSVTATANTYYSFSGWKFSGDNCTHLRYRFGTSGDWLTPVADTTYGASNTTIYVKTDGTSGITTSNAVISAQFTANSYTLSTQAKYSTTGASGTYDTIMTYVPDKSAASGTNASGVTVTADATKVENNYTYQFVSWSCDSGDGTFASATSASTTFKPKKNGALAIALYKRVYKVTTTTNKTEWGDISIDKATPVYNELVTITYTATAGTLKTLTVVNTSTSPATKVKEWTRDADGDMKVTTAQAAQSSANQFTQVGLSGIAGSIYSFIKDAGEALGAKDDSAALGADDALTFNMPAGNVTVSATYEEYIGTSEYIYHGVNTSGQAVSGYENKTMSEGVIGGQKYAYYNVTGRENEAYNQLFYISKGGSTEDRYVYFSNSLGWNNLQVYFFNSSGAVGGAWPGNTMDNVSGSDYRAQIPSGATGVIFLNNGGDNDQTADISLTGGASGAYYIDSNNPGSFKSRTVTSWSTPPADAGLVAGTDYYWDTDVYKDKWYTGGFSNHNVNNVNNFAKPKDGNGQTFSDSKSDYYIVVLYPNTSYTFNLPGHDAETKTVGAKPMVLWMPQLPGQTETVSSYVKVYAKDGTIRRDDNHYTGGHNENDRDYSTFEKHANTFVYSDSGYANHIGVRSSNDGKTSEGTGYDGFTYDYVAKFTKGETLYIKTNIDDTLKATHYLAAYCINGKTYKLHTEAESATGSVTEAFTVPEDWEDKYVEITPIYFLRDSAGTNTITFYIEGYDETVMNAGWGNTPFVYPFYQDANFNNVSNINNAFGGYPGQPMVFYKGNYYIQLPKEITTTISTGQTGTATIKGVTLGNGYWDDIHYHIGEVKSHYQTYDYDDLYKIYNEKNNADRIICAFKYRTKKNNDEPASMSSSIAANYNTTNGNGWEVLTNYYGQPVDVFGNVLTEGSAEYNLAMSIINGSVSADSAAVVHAISQDYKSNSAGDYATEWVIYNTSGTKVVASSGGKTSIVPSALAINANTSGTGELTDNFDKYDNATKAFKSIYTALYYDSNVLNKPAVVTYEKSIYGGGDKADRCDARWYFSQKDAPITATTRIEYTDDGKTWNTDTYTSGTGTGSTTGTKAYFTGKASTATDTPSITTGIDDTNTTTYSGNVGQGYYTIKAENAGQYQFVGWYLLRDNYQNISTRSSYAADATKFPSHAEMSKNGDIFVARFKKTATGTFDIYHEIHPQTTGYGTVDVSAVVKKGDTVLHTYPSNGSGTSSHIQIGNDYIKSGEGNTIVATFTAAPYHTSNFDAFYATVQDLLQDFEGYDYIDSISISGGTATVTYNVDKMFSMASGSPVQTVTNVTHYSKFSLKDNLTYSLEYTFNTRYYDTKLYKYRNVAFTEQELRSYFLDQITDPNCDHIKLDKQFVKAKAPFESNFREDLTWVVDDVTFNDDDDPTIGYLTATQVSKKWATAMVYDFDNNGEMKTKTMVAPFEKLFDESVDTKPTYQSDEAEAQAIKDWSVDNDAMYHPLRTSYVPAGETSSAPLYIDHWDIYQLDSFTYKTTVNNNPKMMDDGYNLDVDLSKSVLVAQAYSSRFNYVGYEDYVVVPVYNKDKVDRQGASDKRKDSSATLLTLTRNQWNANAAGNTDASKYRDSADRVYVDFMLNYNYSVKINGKDTNILLNSTGDNIKVGFIVRSYTWENEEKQYSKAQYVLVDKAQINDKNRMEYCFGFNNTANNRKAGLYYEFKPFIVDTSNQAGSAGCDVTIDNTPYKALYADSTVSVLDQVSFYQLGRL